MKQLLEASDGRVIGEYRILAELGRDEMGLILLGCSPDGHLVALRWVSEQLAADDGFRARLRHEVAALRTVSGPYIEAVVDADPDAATPWLASAFVPGPSLLDAIRTAGPLPEDALLRLAAGLTHALAEVHEVGLVHGDLKPSNVLLAADGPRVIDYGVAQAVDGDDSTRSSRLVGLPEFMSSEQAEGRKPTPASDMFSLGAVLVMAATGRGPFNGPTAVQILYQVAHGEPELSGIPPRLRTIIERCLAKNPADRPTPSQLLASIGELAPSTQPWPAAVHDLIASRSAEAERLLDVTQALRQPPLRRYAPFIADAAMILCTVSSVFIVVSGAGFLFFGLPGVITYISSWASTLDDVVWGIGDALVVVGTILMWCRKLVGRRLAIIGLGIVVLATVGVEIASLLAFPYLIMSPLQYLLNVVTVLSLVFILLPVTGRQLKVWPAP